MYVREAIPRIAGTNQAAILSAIIWIAPFEDWASSTRRIIFDRTVSSPIAVTLKRNRPSIFSVAPETFDPTTFFRCLDSPVSIVSSTLDRSEEHTSDLQ